MIEKSAKRKILASLHALALIMLALIAALSSQFSSIAWFSTNDTVSADGIAVSSVRAGLFEEIHFYRGTHTHLLETATGTKYNEYCFSYDEQALAFSPNGTTPERSSFSDAISMLEHSDLSANSQVLVRIKVSAPGQYRIALNTATTDYLGNLFAAQIQNNGPYDISPSNLPLSSVVHFALLSSATVKTNTQEQVFTLADKDLGSADMTFVSFTDGTGSFRNPFLALPDQKQTVTVGEDCYLYIFVDYHLPAVEDVVEKTLLYVEKAQAANSSYSDIIVGHTNLVFKTDFEFVVEEAAQ